MGGAKNPEEEIFVDASVGVGSEIFTWINISCLPCKQKNKYQIKWPQKAKADELFDRNGICIADRNELGLCSRRMVFVPYHSYLRMFIAD